MNDDARDERGPEDATEALPTTRELPVTQPLPTALNPEVDPHAQGEATQVIPMEPDPAPSDAVPPSVPPRSPSRPVDSPAPEPDAPRRRPPLLTAAVIAVAALTVMGLVLGAMALIGGSGDSAAAASTSASPSASDSASTLAPSPEASDETADSGAATTVGSDGAPGDDGACTADVRKDKSKDGEFEFEVRVKARAGGVETWAVRVDIGDATATEAKDATLVGQEDGIVTVTNDADADPIASGKHTTFTLSGTGEPTGLDIACTS